MKTKEFWDWFLTGMGLMIIIVAIIVIIT